MCQSLAIYSAHLHNPLTKADGSVLSTLFFSMGSHDHGCAK